MEIWSLTETSVNLRVKSKNSNIFTIETTQYLYNAENNFIRALNAGY